MAASMYIVVEGEDPGFNIFVNGRHLARYENAIEELSLSLGVRPLLEFFSADENSMLLLIEEGAGNPELLPRLPPPQWYAADDGLRTVAALICRTRRRPSPIWQRKPSRTRRTARIRNRSCARQPSAASAGTSP
jgi:hypothetical protein